MKIAINHCFARSSVPAENRRSLSLGSTNRAHGSSLLGDNDCVVLIHDGNDFFVLGCQSNISHIYAYLYLFIIGLSIAVIEYFQIFQTVLVFNCGMRSCDMIEGVFYVISSHERERITPWKSGS
jgi:hypothetical protein